jgi:chloramphenicol O-acetyltransferase type B
MGGNCEISTDLIIGNHVLVGSAVGFLARDAHSPYIPGTTMFESPRGDKYRIVIQDDVWIGFGAIILSGITIGRGSVIGAGAIVAKDIPPYSVVIPQRSEVVKPRFSEAEIEIHEAALRSKGIIDDSGFGPIE